MKKARILLVALIFLGIAAFLVSTIMAQRLTNDDSFLIDYDCFKVYPLAVARRDSYTKIMETAKNQENNETINQEVNNFIALSKKYIDAQTGMVNAEKTLLDRWDFKLFAPNYVKEATMSKFLSDKEAKEGAEAIVAAYDVLELSPAIAKEQVDKAMELALKRDEEEKRRKEILEKPRQLDPRMYFIKIPAQECTYK